MLSSSHEDQLANKLRDMQQKRAKALKGKSRRFGNTRTKNIVRIPIRDDPLSTVDPVRKDEEERDQCVNNTLVPTIVVCDPSPPNSSSGVRDVHPPESPQSSPDDEATTDRVNDLVVETEVVPNTRKNEFSRVSPFLFNDGDILLFCHSSFSHYLCMCVLCVGIIRGF